MILAPALKVFWVLAALLAIQSLIALREVFRFLAFVRRRRREPPGDFLPRAAVIIPCKGLDAGFGENLQAFLTQDYPHYQLVFAVAREADPAHAALSEKLRGLPQASLVVAGEAEAQGEKVHNLVQALGAVDPAAEVLAFADIDARPGQDWLHSLVARLADPGITVSTGFRWYLPGTGFASRLRAAWDTSIATMLGEHGRNFAWGGSMAIRASDFRRLQVAERYWKGTVSDDYALARAVRDSRGRIAFEPRCLVASHEESTLAELLHWTNRQIIITHVYAPHLWRLGLAAHLLYATTMLGGVALIFAPDITLTARIGIAAALAAIQILGVAKGVIRTVVARETFPEEQDLRGNSYWTLEPIVPWLMLYNFVVAGFARRIEWRGTVYELRSMSEVRVLRRD
ncbi:MAG: glycosyltransferase [Acidobacteria bacterium]|nr:glycosyltransferase [Acidobacteriota bacterium]